MTALFTLLTDTVADPLVGMTGEITLRGLVLPIGGVKEKLLAAHRAGLKKVILPARNQRDLHEVPDEARQALQLVFAEQVEDVLLAAVPALKVARKPRRRAAATKPRSSKKPKPGAKQKGAAKSRSRKKTARQAPSAGPGPRAKRQAASAAGGRRRSRS